MTILKNKSANLLPLSGIRSTEHPREGREQRFHAHGIFEGILGSDSQKPESIPNTAASFPILNSVPEPENRFRYPWSGRVWS